MSMPDEPGPNDEFWLQLNGLDASIEEVDVTKLSDVELTDKFGDCRQKLLEIGEMLNPKTQEGRELHSLRSAYLIEMNKRWPEGNHQ